MRTSKYFQTGYLLPRILVILFVVDMFLRVVPLNRFAFRALEAARRRTPSCVGPFEPNAQIHIASSYGDLSSMGNLPVMREYRTVTFTTDSLGFHNPDSLLGVPDSMIIGDSFALSAEVREDRTLAAQLSAQRGRPVYNAAEAEPLRLGPIRELAQHLGMQHGYVVYEFLERHLVEPPPLKTGTGVAGMRAIPPKLLGATRWEEVRLPIWRLIEITPLEALAQKVDKRVRNGVWLPNQYLHNVLIRRLINGDTLLFSALDTADTNVPELRFESWADYWSWLSGELRQVDLTLVVLLVPNKYTVYQPLFSTPEMELSGAKNLHQLEQRLNERGVPVVNLTNPYRIQATADLDKHVYLYWRDDTHWNERGMKIAAEGLQQVLAREDLLLAKRVKQTALSFQSPN